MILLISLLLVAGAPESQQDLSAVQQQSAYDHFRAGMQALLAERYEEAEQRFRKAVTIDPLYDAAFYGLGQTYMATQQYDRAVRAYLDSREAYKASVAAEALGKATGERRLRDQIQALRDYVRSLERMSPARNPNLQSAVYRNREQIRQLESRLNRSTVNGATVIPSGLSMALGSAYFRSGDLAAAEREYLAAVAADSGFGEAHNNLAVVYMLTGRLEQAEQAVRLAEKGGFRVAPQLKEDLRKRRGGR